MFIIVVFIINIAIGIFANNLGRSFFGWFLLSCFITPIATAVLLLVLGEVDAKKCSACAETVKKDAAICKHCGTVLRTDVTIKVTA